MDSSLLFQLSYPGVVPEVYVEAEAVASRSFGHALLSHCDVRQGWGMTPEREDALL